MRTFYPSESVHLNPVDFVYGSEFIDQAFFGELIEERIKFYHAIEAVYSNEVRIPSRYMPIINRDIIEDAIPFHLRSEILNDFKHKNNNVNLKQEVTVSGNTLVMPLTTNSKGHFILEVIPYLSIANTFEINNILFYTEYNENFEFLIDNYFKNKINYIYFNNQNIRLENAIIPKYRFSAHSSMKKTVSIILNNIKKNQDSEIFENIFISRQDSVHYRTLLNEDKVVKIFEEYGFKILKLNGMNESKLIQYFLNAKYIAGPLGAGLYNSIYSSNTAKIIALNSPNYNLSFLDDCISINNAKRGYIFGPEFISYDDSHKGCHNNFLIDTQYIKDFLKKEF